MLCSNKECITDTKQGDRAEITEALICVGGTQEERASYGVYLGELWKRTVLWNGIVS